MITNCHQKKLTNLRKQQERKTDKPMVTYIKNTVHNFSSYRLSKEEYTALSYGLDQHIPYKFNNNRIHTEFEQFYQSILKDISHIPESDLSCLKTKMRNTCEKYSKMQVPNKYKKVIDQLSRNRNLCILKQDKGRGVVSVLVPKLNDYVKKWRCFVDGTFVYIKHGSTEYVLSILNSFHDNIKFTYEQENNNRLPFLDFYLLGITRK